MGIRDLEPERDERASRLVELEVQALRPGWLLRHPREAEVEVGPVGHRQPGLVAGVLVGQGLGAEPGFPGPAEGLRINSVEDDVLQVHDFTLGGRPSRVRAVFRALSEASQVVPDALQCLGIVLARAGGFADQIGRDRRAQ